MLPSPKLYMSSQFVVRLVGGYRLIVTFADGTSGEVDLSRLVTSDDAGVFEQLRNPAILARVGVAQGAVTWPKGVDLAPDAMYDEIRAKGRWVPCGDT